jgi:hypothetical protein
MHPSGIEPEPIAWKAIMIPFHHGSLWYVMQRYYINAVVFIRTNRCLFLQCLLNRTHHFRVHNNNIAFSMVYDANYLAAEIISSIHQRSTFNIIPNTKPIPRTKHLLHRLDFDHYFSIFMISDYPSRVSHDMFPSLYGADCHETSR